MCNEDYIRRIAIHVEGLADIADAIPVKPVGKQPTKLWQSNTADVEQS
jgi:hypothetical protein